MRGISFLYNSINVNVIRTRAWDKCYVLAPLDTLGIPWLRDAPQIAEEDHWQGVGEVVASHLGLEGKAPQALVVLALGLPTLEDHRQVLAGSPATGFRIASLTGGSVGLLTHFQTLSDDNCHPSSPCSPQCSQCILSIVLIFCFRQCQGTPGRCVDPCTNNVETGINWDDC